MTSRVVRLRSLRMCTRRHRLPTPTPNLPWSLSSLWSPNQRRRVQHRMRRWIPTRSGSLKTMSQPRTSPMKQVLTMLNEMDGRLESQDQSKGPPRKSRWCCYS